MGNDNDYDDDDDGGAPSVSADTQRPELTRDSSLQVFPHNFWTMPSRYFLFGMLFGS